MAECTIEPLAHHPEQIGALALLLHREWGHLDPWSNVAELKTLLEARCQGEAAPFALVALDGAALMESASVKLHELPHHQDKLHWIGDVIVALRVPTRLLNS